mmetsp:Transcript_24480/g.21735  ORF Transcript_24480/g.21735 Transcript_24480/m.21735 type:complete len:194 (+) Transcript_24480:147-728(+)
MREDSLFVISLKLKLIKLHLLKTDKIVRRKAIKDLEDMIEYLGEFKYKREYIKKHLYLCYEELLLLYLESEPEKYERLANKLLNITLEAKESFLEILKNIRVLFTFYEKSNKNEKIHLIFTKIMEVFKPLKNKEPSEDYIFLLHFGLQTLHITQHNPTYNKISLEFLKILKDIPEYKLSVEKVRIINRYASSL